MKRVVIVGGGITGLAVAHALEKSAEACRVHLFEATPRLGGNIRTVWHSGFTIDGGPDSWVATKPHATRLARAVGLGDELIGTRPESRKVHILWQRRLHPMPEGLVLGIPTEVGPLAKSDLLPLDAKLRALFEPLVPRKDLTGPSDESIASFVTRRLGAEFSERLVSPLLGGIFAGDAEALSVRACVPQLVEAEREYGSLVLAMRAQKARRDREREAAGAKDGETPSVFTSLKRGMGDLVTHVAHRLRDADVATEVAVTGASALPPGDPRGRFRVETSRGAHIECDHLVVTTPAHAAARVLRGVSDDIADELASFAYSSTATVFLAYRKFDVKHDLEGTGFLVPASEGRPLLACTFVSSKWEHRAPSGQVLLRVFFGGARGADVLDADDDALVRLAREELLDVLGIERKPSFTRVFRFDLASPQPGIGHVSKMERLRALLAERPGLYVGGNGYLGTGIPDAIKQGEEIADAVMASARR
ncbi:MAG: protoporphyrinogen oxidase [Myxococcales bacterium]|nr:protoporphyrinogen oxidase [Myxococcales bacterium]